MARTRSSVTDAVDENATCGVIVTSTASGPVIAARSTSGTSGSAGRTSSAAAPGVPVRSADTRASVSTRAPRDVLTSNDPGRMAASSVAPISGVAPGTAGTWRLTTSLRANRSAGDTTWTPAGGTTTERLWPTTVQPNAANLAAVAEPIAPRPHTPTVRSRTRRRSRIPGRQRPSRTSRSNAVTPRAQLWTSATTWSDTSSTQ